MIANHSLTLGSVVATLVGGFAMIAAPHATAWLHAGHAGRDPGDAIAEAQTPREIPAQRPEQAKTDHDRSGVFDAAKARPSSSALADQPDRGGNPGFDFYRDPLNSKRPMETFEAIGIGWRS